MRVGLYLELLEAALRTAYSSAPPKGFNGRKTLASTTRRGSWWKANYEWHDFGAIAIFALLAYGSIAIGAYRAYAQHESTVIVLVVLESLLLSALAIRFLLEVATARQRVRQSLSTNQQGDPDPAARRDTSHATKGQLSFTRRRWEQGTHPSHPAELTERK